MCMDQVVTSFGEEDVKQLGDNVVLILNTVKSLTQPEMLNLVNGLTAGFHAAEAEADAGRLDTGLFGLHAPDARPGGPAWAGDHARNAQARIAADPLRLRRPLPGSRGNERWE